MSLPERTTSSANVDMHASITLAEGEATAKRKLTRADYDRYLPLVRRTAMKLARRLPSHVTVADLISYGWVGLLDAFDRASPGMDENEFEAYAMYRVRGAALDYLRTLDPAPRAARALSRRVARAMSQLTNENKGKTPEEPQIAQRLDMTVEQYRSAMEHLGRVGMNRLEMLDIDEMQSVSKQDDILPEERTAKKELQGLVAAAIKTLPERLQLVLALYYQEERSLREIGVILEVSESRVCQLHTEAIHRLRAAAGRNRMSRGVYVALSGAVAQERALETTAENLANATTAGYQRMRPIFKEALSKATNNKPALRYTEVSATTVDQSRGALKATGRKLDVALPEGNYLAVATPRGERYTRAGSLAMDASGILRAAGQPLARDDGEPLQLSPTAGEPTIGTDGSVWQAGAVVAKLKIMRGDTGTTFSHEGNGLMAATGAMVAGTPTQADANAVEVGVVEESNATPVSAMTDLVTASRTFEAFQKMLDTFGDCDRKVLTTTAAASES